MKVTLARLFVRPHNDVFARQKGGIGKNEVGRAFPVISQDKSTHVDRGATHVGHFDPIVEVPEFVSYGGSVYRHDFVND